MKVLVGALNQEKVLLRACEDFADGWFAALAVTACSVVPVLACRQLTCHPQTIEPGHCHGGTARIIVE